MSKPRIGIAVLVVAAVLSSAALAKGGGGHGGGGHGGGGMAVAVTAEVGAAASVACISAAATTPVRGTPFHIRFREEAFAAAVLLRVAAGGISPRSETPRCDPEVSAVL